MQKYKVAHIHHSGTDIILVPLDKSFEHKSPTEQNQQQAILQTCAASAGLDGIVIPVWEVGNGGLKSLAPSQWSSFATSLTWDFIRVNINKELTCN